MPVRIFRTARHDATRDFCVAFHQKVTNFAAPAELVVAAWNRTNTRTRVLEETKLDVVTRDAVTGNVV